jgi:hypothetical protein
VNERIYIVTQKMGEAKTHRLVKAPNVTQAIRHVAKDTIRAGVASQDELLEMVLIQKVPVELVAREEA